MQTAMFTERLSKEKVYIEWRRGPFFNEGNKEASGRTTIEGFPCLLPHGVNLLSKQKVQINLRQGMGGKYTIRGYEFGRIEVGLKEGTEGCPFFDQKSMFDKPVQRPTVIES